jgi:hypothetical protein
MERAKVSSKLSKGLQLYIPAEYAHPGKGKEHTDVFCRTRSTVLGIHNASLPHATPTQQYQYNKTPLGKAQPLASNLPSKDS